jgi:hypothetical protein
VASFHDRWGDVLTPFCLGFVTFDPNQPIRTIP